MEVEEPLVGLGVRVRVRFYGLYGLGLFPRAWGLEFRCLGVG